MNKQTKVMMITFAVFMTEAMLHYNIGKSEVKEQSIFPTKESGFFPPMKSLVKIGGVVLLFSFINSVVIKNAT